KSAPRWPIEAGFRERCGTGGLESLPVRRSRNLADPNAPGTCVTKIMPVIMCGGSGTRVWPESRESLPKQFIPLIGQRSTFQSIVSLVSDPEVFDRPVVITNFAYRFRVSEQLREIGAEA